MQKVLQDILNKTKAPGQYKYRNIVSDRFTASILYNDF